MPISRLEYLNFDTYVLHIVYPAGEPVGAAATVALDDQGVGSFLKQYFRRHGLPSVEMRSVFGDGRGRTFADDGAAVDPGVGPPVAADKKKGLALL